MSSRDWRKGVYIPRGKARLGGLRATLQSWTNSIDDYTKRHKDEDKGDALYWYNERATLSTLACAAARCGAVVLEEYRLTKGKGKDTIEGRADIWMDFGKRWYVGESKQTWPGISKRRTGKNAALKTALKSAVAAAKQTGDSESDSEPLAILFCVPRLKLSAGPPEDVCPQLVDELLDEVINLSPDAVAWCFPCEPNVQNEESEYWYPGVICLIKSLARGK